MKSKKKMEEEAGTSPRLSGWQQIVLGCPIALMVAVCVGGGWGTYHNIQDVYGADTAFGVLAAGEGATAVLALLMLGLTVLGQSVPLVLRIGLWVLPIVAATMSATAAKTDGEMVVYAATPMAITAGAEGLAFLVRRIVVHLNGCDVDAQARDADTLRALAYHRARAASHPWRWVKGVSELRSWRLARKVGRGDAALGAELLTVQRERITAGADTALTDMYAPSADTSTLTKDMSGPELETSAEPAPALPPVSSGDTTTPEHRDITIPADTSGYPAETTPDQPGNPETIRPDLEIVRDAPEPQRSMRGDVRQMVDDGVKDVGVMVDTVASRHGRDPKDKTLRQTVAKYAREARADTPAPEPEPVGQYL